MRKFLFFILLISYLSASGVKGYYAKNKEVKSFINYMIKRHNFKRSYLEDVFSRAGAPRPFKYKKIKRKLHYGYIYRRSRYLKPVGYTRHERAFLTKDRVYEGVRFVKKYKTLFSKVENKFKVDKYIVAAIIGIESYYGESKGRWEAFNTLAYHTFKDKKRARFFRYELEHLLLLAYRQKLNALYLKGSKYGALGLGQLMPHSYIKYGVSFDGNSRIEPFSNPDSIATVANFLHKKGWSYQKPVAIKANFRGKRANIKENRVYSLKSLRDRGFKIKKTKAKRLKAIKLKRVEYEEVWLVYKNFNVLKRYNNSNYYAMAVYHLAKEIEKLDERN